MGHRSEAHEWGQPYEHQGSTYRDCTGPDCGGYQEWICALDRWSEAFTSPSPRGRLEEAPPRKGSTETPDTR